METIDSTWVVFDCMSRNSIILGTPTVAAGPSCRSRRRVEGFGFASTASSICRVGFVTYFM